MIVALNPTTQIQISCRVVRVCNDTRIRAYLRILRRRTNHKVVGADGFEPPTFAL